MLWRHRLPALALAWSLHAGVCVPAMAQSVGETPAAAESVVDPAVPSTPGSRARLDVLKTDARARRVVFRQLVRAGRYLATLRPILTSGAVPEWLVWVCGVESSFDVESGAPSGAAGLWQFMPQTARNHGLRVDPWVDERRDPIASTRAAATFLRGLRTRFGAWDLALAAYNMGPAALSRALARTGAHDFTELAALEGAIPAETREYVPRVLALATVATSPAAHGTEAPPEDPPLAYDEVSLDRSIRLDALATALGIEPRVLRDLNPALRGGRTPPADADHDFVLRVPAGLQDAAFAFVAAFEEPAVTVARLRHGETLDDLAATHGTDAPSVLALSGLPSARGLGPGTELLVPVRDSAARRAPSLRPVILLETAREVPRTGRHVLYRAEANDPVPSIARWLGVSTADLARWNHLEPQGTVPSGAWLHVWIETAPDTARVWTLDEVEVLPPARDGDTGSAPGGHELQRIVASAEDTWESLATRFGVRASLLARWNHRSRGVPLRPGTPLWVPAPTAPLTSRTDTR